MPLPDPSMRVGDFDFALPEDRIALRPAEPRETARLLVVDPTGGLEFSDRTIADLPRLLMPGDALVLNDTRVIPARLEGVRRREAGTGAAIEAMLHRRVASDRWLAFVRPAKRLTPGDRIAFGGPGKGDTCLLGTLDATVEAKRDGGEVTLRFDLTGAALDEAIMAAGHIPLPPYIALKRPDDVRDRTDYQTVFAREEGAVAAPTAGLHLTAALLGAIAECGITRHFVTLHVGAGTFLPVKSEIVAEHVMHAEWGRVPAETAEALNAVRRAGGRIVAVGTTAIRLLESAARPDGTIGPFEGETAIFITPGYHFKTADVLLTNFHLPRSTLMMLVSAFAGTDRMQRAYRHAIETGYRFYSYGDACLLHRDEGRA